LLGQGMQDVDGIRHIQALSEPSGAGPPHVEAKAVRVVLGSETHDWIGGHWGWRRNVGQEPTIRALEPQRAV